MDKKTEEQLMDEQYPAKDYHKKFFSISNEDFESLKPFEDATALINVFFTLGQIAQRAKDQYVSQTIIPKLGIKESVDTKVTYDLLAKKIVAYEPRNWCSKCGNKKAEYKYQDKLYCQKDIEEIKKEIGDKIETEEPKKEEKEVKEEKKEEKKEEVKQ